MAARWIATGYLQNSGNVEYLGDDQPEGYRFYMYELEDPRDGKVFYIGKGTGNRILHHERDAAKLAGDNIQKELTIRSIWDDGLQVVRRIRSWHKTSAQAITAERVRINELGLDSITNISRGSYGEDYRAGVTSAILLDRYKGLMEKASGIRRANLEMICRELQEAVDMASKVCGVSFSDCSYYVPTSSIK